MGLNIGEPLLDSLQQDKNSNFLHEDQTTNPITIGTGQNGQKWSYTNAIPLDAGIQYQYQQWIVHMGQVLVCKSHL